MATPHLDDIKNARCIHPEDNEEAREHTAPDAQDTTPCCSQPLQQGKEHSPVQQGQPAT